MHTIDYAVIVIYFSIIIGVAIYVSKKKGIKSEDDFLLAGRRLNLPLFIGGLSSVCIGGATVTTASSLGYSVGIAAIWLGGSCAVGVFFLSFLMNTKMKKMEVYTTNQVLGTFYGPGARYMGAVVSFVYLVLIGVLQVMAIGTAVSTMLGFNYKTGMIVGACIILIYLCIGGMVSVAYTDFIQFIIMAIGCIILAPIFATSSIGGIGALSNLPASYFDLTAVSIPTIIAWLIVFVPGYLVGQDIWQRALSAKDVKTRIRGCRLSALFILIFVCGCILLGLCLAASGVKLENPSMAFATSIVTFMPIGLRGLLLCSLMAAILSSANGAILGAGSVLYNDLINQFTKKEHTPKQIVNILRMISAGVIIVVTIIATSIQDLVTGCDLAYEYITGCMFIPMVFGLLLKKVSAKAGLSAIIVSFIVTTILIIILGPTSDVTLISGIGSNAAVFFIVHALDKSKKEIDIDEETGNDALNNAEI